MVSWWLSYLSDYIDLLKASGWQLTHIVDCPLPLRAVGSTLRAGSGAGGHTAISAKHGEPDAQEPNPGSRSTLPDCRNKAMIETASSARGPVSYDVIVALRKQEQFIKKNTWRDHGQSDLMPRPVALNANLNPALFDG